MAGTELDQRKQAAREAAAARRDAIEADARQQAALDIVGQLATQSADLAAVLGEGHTWASYRPMGSELNPIPLEISVRKTGCAIALPVTPKRGSPLSFRRWQPGEPLRRHRFGMLEPAGWLALTRPAVVLVPLLAFDRSGFRLGYGGGYYDRTLAELRASGPCLALGLAYDDQEMAEVPHDKRYDEQLDGILTPQRFERFREWNV